MFEDLLSEELVEVPTDLQDPEQCGIGIDILDGHTHNHDVVSEAPLLQAVAPPLQAYYELFLRGEHRRGVLLIGLQLGQQEMRPLLVYQEVLTQLQ